MSRNYNPVDTWQSSHPVCKSRRLTGFLSQINLPCICTEAQIWKRRISSAREFIGQNYDALDCYAMGQVIDKLRGRQWRQRQIRKITDKVFERFKNQSGRANLSFEDLYIAVLLVYNDINKHLPGPHFDPPPKDQIRALMQECDINLDGEIDHEEFVKFMELLTSDTFMVVSRGLIITLVVAPTVAMVTKRSTEGVPGVGKVVQKLPNSLYASLVTLAIVLIQSSSSEI